MRFIGKLCLASSLLCVACGSGSSSQGPAGPAGPKGANGSPGQNGTNGSPGQSAEDQLNQSLSLILPLQPSAVLIYCWNSNYSWSGSGIKISATEVLTANHVWTNTSEGTASTCNIYTDAYTTPIGKATRELQSAEGRDIAVLSISPSSSVFGSLPIASMQDDSTINIGDQVFLMSHPLGWFDPEVTMGNVANIQSTYQNSNITPPGIDWSDAVDVSISATNGSSGGPIFNPQGKVIGILVAGPGAQVGVGALPIEIFLRLESADNL